MKMDKKTVTVIEIPMSDDPEAHCRECEKFVGCILATLLGPENSCSDFLRSK